MSKKNDLYIDGTITHILPLESGSGSRGEWRKQQFVIETEGKYPKSICLTAWGDLLDDIELEEGMSIRAHINIESREYKDRWYTDVRAWKIESGDAGSDAGNGYAPRPAPTKTANEAVATAADDLDDDLPF